MESSLIPNSFQTPNLYVDRLMPLLTPEECVVLLYAVRRIFGFGKRRDRISLRQFERGICARNGDPLDGGTGLTRATILRALEGLETHRVLCRSDPGDRARSVAAEWELQLDPREITWEALEGRREARQRGNRERTRAASEAVSHTRSGGDPATCDVAHPGSCDEPPRATCDEPPPGSCDEPPPGPWDEPPPGPCDEPPPGSSHGARPGSSDEPTKPRETQGETQMETQSGNPGGGVLAEVMPWPEEAAPAGLARHRLEEVGLRGEVLDYLTASPQRCYWSAQWANWYPAVQHRVRGARGFIIRRVEGACAGRAEDRTPPREWWDLQDREERERRRREKELSQRASPLPQPLSRMGRDEPRVRIPPLPPEVAEPWERFLNAQREDTREAWLLDAYPVQWDERGLTVRAQSRLAAEWLNRKQSRLMARVREVDPEFPEVWFVASDVADREPEREQAQELAAA